MKLFNESLAKVSAQMLEEWAMMLVDPAEDGAESFDREESFYLVRAAYTGVFGGDLVLVCQGGFKNSLAANLLGLDFDETPKDEEALDALKELANVISGNFITDAFGEEAVFELPVLSVVESSYDEVKQYLNDDMIYYLGDDMPIGFRVEIAADETAEPID